MGKIRIEEFPHICPKVVRDLVIRAAEEANAFVLRGKNVCGVGIREENGHLVGSTYLITGPNT